MFQHDMARRLSPLPILLIAAAASCQLQPTAAAILFHPPVILHGGPHGLDGNETRADTFYALNRTHLFGAYRRFQGGSMPFVQSSDAGRSWRTAPSPHSRCHAQDAPGPSCWPWDGTGLSGHANPRAPRTLRTLGNLSTHGPPAGPWTGFASNSSMEILLDSQTGGIGFDQSPGRGVTFSGLPPFPRPKKWCDARAGWDTPLAITVLPDGSYLAASTVCFGIVPTTFDPEASATSLIAWRSTDAGLNYKYAGVIVDAKDVVPHNSTRGPTNEVDLAMTARVGVVMAVIRMDGDCHCSGATGRDHCGLYRPYFQSYSSDLGRSCKIPHVPARGSRA